MPRLRWLLRLALDVVVAHAFMRRAYDRGVRDGLAAYDRVAYDRGYDQGVRAGMKVCSRPSRPNKP